MAGEPQPDLFNAIRNRISIILIKLQRYSRNRIDKDSDEHIAFWLTIEKEFDILAELVKEKRVGKRHKGPTYVQKQFLWLFSVVIMLLFGIIYEVYASHQVVDKKTQINFQNH